MIWKALIAIVVLGLPALQAQAEEPVLDHKMKALKGLGSIRVVVEDLGRDAAKTGLSVDELKATVELRLRQSGVAVHNTNQQTLESPFLYLNIHLLKVEQSEVFVFSTTVELTQRVLRLQVGPIMATTWSAPSFLGLGTTETVGAKAKQSLDSQLTYFLNDYLAANPKAEK